MSKRIYFQGNDEDTVTPCEVGPDLLSGFTGECEEDAGWLVEDDVSRVSWLVCDTHKDAVKAAGIAR